MHANSFAELVPKRYRAHSGVDSLTLAVRNPCFRPFALVRGPDGSSQAIAPSAFCTFVTDLGPVHLLIDLAQCPALADSVLSLGRLLFTHPRADKYMTLYKVYEALEPSPALRFSAVRHALSHHPAMLQRRGTVAELLALFGTTAPDLELPRHARPFYQRFAELLGVTDRLVASSLRQALPTLRVVRRPSDVLHH